MYEKSQKATQFNRTGFHFLQNLYQFYLVTCLANILKNIAFWKFAIKTPA